MSDEIKEILELIGNSYYYGNIAEEQKEKYCNYITNLQTIEREYSNLLSENAELQQENDRLNNIINELEEWLNDRIEYFVGDVDTQDIYNDVFNKLEELKENK